jgi:hypothetical protein
MMDIMCEVIVVKNRTMSSLTGTELTCQVIISDNALPYKMGSVSIGISLLQCRCIEYLEMIVN